MLIGLDTETHLIRPGLLAPPMVCVSFYKKHEPDEREPQWGVLAKKQGAAWVREWLKDGHTLVLHNAAFDMAVLCAFDPTLMPLVFQAYKEGRIKDTMIRQTLIDITMGRKTINGRIFVMRNGELVLAKYHLSDLEQLYLGRDRSSEKNDPGAWRLRYSELDDVPVWPREAYDYALADAEGALEVYLKQEELAGGPIPTEDLQARAHFALHLMSCWGMRTDGESVRALKEDLLIESKKNRRRIEQAGFLKTKRATKKEVEEGKVDFWEEGKKGPRPMRFARDMAAIKAYVERVYKRQGKDAPRTATGTSTDKDTMYESGSRLLKALADGGGVDKLLNTYVPVLERGVNAAINAAYQVLVNSGRTSCREPNYQNLPSGRRKGGVRECHVPNPGFVYSSVDYDTLELRGLAQTNLWVQGFSKMAEAINAGQDLHLAMAASMLRIPYEEAEARKEAADPEVLNARQVAKIGNFGLPGGLGVESLIDFARTTYGMRLTREEAQRIKNEWTAAWPEMKGYFRWINDQVGYGEATITHLTTGFVRGGLGYTEACNHFFQHLAATGAKIALFDLVYEMYVVEDSPLFGSRLVAFIHDEFICEHPEEIAAEASQRVAEIACAAMQSVVPDVKIEASPALMRRWYKKAIAVYDNTGRLVPWEPKEK